MIILGISCYYHDAAACIVQDGRVVAAAQEERFTRIKHDNSFPINAIKFCLDWMQIKPAEIDLVVFYEKPVVKFERVMTQFVEGFPYTRTVFTDTIGSWFKEKLRLKALLKKRIGYTGKVEFIPHHLSHAASSFYLSGFKESVIVTFDGVGEWATTTVGFGNGDKITIDNEIRFPHSLGLFYSALTAYLGFKVNNDEYKVMGLAAYGDPRPYEKQFDDLLQVFPDGSFALNMDYFTFIQGERMTGIAFEKLFGQKTRVSESKMTSVYENIAAAGQKKLEEAVFEMLNKIYTKYKSHNLCLSGGVALNSVMNGKLLSRTPFKKIYIPPDPGDGGGAMGAAIWGWQKHNNYYYSSSDPSAEDQIDLPAGRQGSIKVKFSTPHSTNSLVARTINNSFTPYLGPSFSENQIEDTLKSFHLKYKKLERLDLLDEVSNLIIKEKIIGWFQGRMEWGPRALGARSILASARREKMKDIINAKVKHREMFRPFAPVILEKHVNEYFMADKNLSPSAKYMLMVYPFKDKGKKDVPATVHVDGSGRLQVLDRESNSLYYDLIEAYYKKTGVPIIINTSFNVRGEPIVCTPKDAVKCFLGTEIDYLVIGSYIVKKGKT